MIKKLLSTFHFDCFLYYRLFTRLTLNTAAADACHDVFSQENEHQEQRSGDDGNSSHLHGVVHITGGAGKCVTQTVGDHAVGIVIGNQAGPHVGVPCTHHLQDSDGKNIQNKETGQNAVKNILCQPTDKEMIKIYKENKTVSSDMGIFIFNRLFLGTKIFY